MHLQSPLTTANKHASKLISNLRGEWQEHLRLELNYARMDAFVTHNRQQTHFKTYLNFTKRMSRCISTGTQLRTDRWIRGYCEGASQPRTQLCTHGCICCSQLSTNTLQHGCKIYEANVKVHLNWISIMHSWMNSLLMTAKTLKNIFQIYEANVKVHLSQNSTLHSWMNLSLTTAQHTSLKMESKSWCSQKK